MDEVNNAIVGGVNNDASLRITRSIDLLSPLISGQNEERIRTLMEAIASLREVVI